MIICPVCHSNQSHFALSVKDHSVSGQFFDIWECAVCSLRFTKEAPSIDQIGIFYESEDYISHSNTRKGVVNNLYHAVRNHTLNIKVNLIKKITGRKNGNHLDIGAGTGAFVQIMNKKGWKSSGIEPDLRARQLALELHSTELMSAESFQSLKPESYDAISMWHVLEHVHALFPYMNRIKEILKPDGFVFIAVPNYTSYDGKRYGSEWAAYDVPRHLYHFSPASMQRLLNESGFELTGMVPMWYDSFYISLLSEKYSKGRFNLLKGFISGFISDLKAIPDKKKCSSLIYVCRKA
jgi:2-polyprenyl-3-methyl-5-hydroxy-6-metoxy-1,4-benzoquinol methylase